MEGISGVMRLKTVCVLSYCYEMMREAEEQKSEGKGLIIIDDELELEESRKAGLKIMQFMEDNNCTKEFLSNKLRQELRSTAKRYYETIIRIYYKHLGDRVVPLLFSATALEFLQERNSINIDTDWLDSLKISFMNSEHLEKEEFTFMNKTKKRSVEVLKYSECIEDIFRELDKPRKSKKKKRK